MASTNKTTNYELSQFIETDRPAWLTDYNSDMRKIDSNLKEVSDIAGGASGSISALADRMSAAEGNITTNANDIDALEARADSLEAQAQSAAGTIANIQTEQAAQNLGIEAATELGYNLARPYDSASTYAVGDYVLFQNTLYKCVTAIATGEAFDPTKWLAIKATDEMNSGGYTLPIASASQLGGVKVGDGLSIDPVTGLLSSNGYTLPIASANTLGGVKIGDNLSIDPVTGLLNASGGVSVQIVDIDNTNNPLTLKSLDMSNKAGSLSNATFDPSLLKGIYAKLGDLRILQFIFALRFDSAQFQSDDFIAFNMSWYYNVNIIDYPSSDIELNSIDQTIRMGKSQRYLQRVARHPVHAAGTQYIVYDTVFFIYHV